MKLKGRNLPDTAMTTYFGKPAFHAYGNGNTKPSNGGVFYGQFMKTHNVNPHSGDNKPECVQVYNRAMLGRQVMTRSPKRGRSAVATKLENVQARYLDGFKNGGHKIDPAKGIPTEKVKAPKREPKDPFTRYPEPPRYSKLKNPLTGEQLDEQKGRQPIMPENFAPENNLTIKQPKIAGDPNLEHAHKLKQHVKSVSTLKIPSARKSNLMQYSQRSEMQQINRSFRSARSSQ